MSQEYYSPVCFYYLFLKVLWEDFQSVNFIKSKNLPFPLVLAIAGFAIKAFGSYSLLTNKHKKIAIPLLILFVATVIVVFNNPLVDESKLWMCMALLGVIGGLILALKD